ncbi:MAG: ribonuclease H-like domain-containing protein [Armatimonadota bacterium]
MLSRRLRRRLRQIDEGPQRDRAASEPAEEAGQRAEPGTVRVGDPALSRSRLARRAPDGQDADASWRAGAGGAAPVATGPLEELAPGEVVECPEGAYWLVAGPAREMLPHGAEILSRFERLTALLGDPEGDPLDDLRGLAPTELVLLDTETAGLSAAPIFLVGVIVWESDAPSEALSLQLFARDYAEERAVLSASAELLRGRKALMTYNGRSFDMPLMRERMVYHGLGDCPEPAAHVDLLHAIRARFRGKWENCRLQTCEQRLCGRSRWGDIEGAQIPDAWHDFVHTGEAGRMAQVLEHNRLDLITMLEILPHLKGSSEDK